MKNFWIRLDYEQINYLSNLIFLEIDKSSRVAIHVPNSWDKDTVSFLKTLNSQITDPEKTFDAQKFDIKPR